MKALRCFMFCAASVSAAAVFAVNYEEIAKAVEPSGDDVAPITSDWQQEHAQELAAATSPEALAACVESRDAARALLDGVKPAYETDPLAAFRIAAVTRYVMNSPEPSWYAFWRRSRHAERVVWTESLMDRARWADDGYVKIFCIEQLRWCAFPGQADAVRALGEGCEKGVHEFAAQVADEIATRGT